jgi:hypothetical protein
VVAPRTWASETNVAALVLMGDEEHLGMDRGADGVPGLQDIVFEVRAKTWPARGAWWVRADGGRQGTASRLARAALRRRARRRGAVGDWMNDVPMLKRAGQSFAMAQARPR